MHGVWVHGVSEGTLGQQRSAVGKLLGCKGTESLTVAMMLCENPRIDPVFDATECPLWSYLQ
eukprot:9283476-Lingulodinium_polyedra.AAC.1